MSLPAIAIKKPVFAIMMSAMLVIFGVLSFFNIPLQENPNINYPIITITTNLPGAGPALVNETVSKPIENVLNTISGLQHLNTSSTQGQSSIEMQFNLGTNMTAAFLQVESALNQVQGELPSGAKPPVVSQSNSSAEPIMMLALYGNESLDSLSTIARNIVKPKLENVNGVGSITVQGSGDESVYIDLDLHKAAALNISPEDIQSAISNEQIQQPGGFIQSGNKQYALNLNLDFQTLDKLGELIVAYRDNAPIKLNDIATLKMTSDSSQSFAAFNGLPTVGLSIVKKSDANTVSIAKAVKERIKTGIKPILDQGIKLKVVYSAATYILQTVHSLETDIWLSIIAAGFIIWVFLRNFRSTIVIVSAIPVSIFGVVMVMYFTGFTFNIVTLLALILLVGVVVDDSIVVLENIFRRKESLGEDAETASLNGSNQVLFAVLASSLTLICIFVPVIFMSNIIGLFFKSFAIVVSTGVLISLFVSLTLTPVLCSHLLNQKKKHAPKLQAIYLFLSNTLDKIEAFYKRVLSFSLRFRWFMLLVALVLVLISAPIFITIGKTMLPNSNNTGYFYITLQTPQGSSTAYTKTRITKIEALLKQYPDIANYYASISQANQGSLTVEMVPAADQRLSQVELMSILEKQLQQIPGVVAFVSTSGQAGNMTFSVLGPNYNDTITNGITLYNALQKYPGIGMMYIDLSFNQPQYIASLDRSLASSLGITAGQFAGTLAILGQGIKIGKFNKADNSNQLDIVLRSKPGQFQTPEDISQLYLIGSAGEPVRLDTISTLINSLAPVSINRLDMNYSLGFSTTPKISTNKAIQLVEEVGEKVLPKGYYVTMTGNTASMGQTVHSVIVTFCLIILLIYMVLASQFNSFIQPIIILVAQPLALIGGILVLWITGQTLNIYSMIGMLLLMGLVAKNSILLIDLTNQQRQEGASIEEALKKACPLRMRPVLMTSLAIIFAMLPSAFSTGAGSDADHPLSLVIIGGMVSSTLLTLVIVPAFYSLVENALTKFRHKKI